jgi:hypothetical protein
MLTVKRSRTRFTHKSYYEYYSFQEECDRRMTVRVTDGRLYEVCTKRFLFFVVRDVLSLSTACPIRKKADFNRAIQSHMTFIIMIQQRPLLLLLLLLLLLSICLESSVAFVARNVNVSPWRMGMAPVSSSRRNTADLLLYLSSTPSVPQEEEEEESAIVPPVENDAKTKEGTEALSPLQKLRRTIASYYTPPDDGLTVRQRLAQLGLAALLSYGWVSNMSYCVTVSCAWYIFSCRTGLSPLQPGQWKPFLAVYAGFWVLNNVLRPLRLAVSVGLVAPQFERFLQALELRLRVSRPVAIALTVFLANVVGTLSFMSLGIVGASLLAKVPLWGPRL